MRALVTADLHGGLKRYGAATPGGTNTRVLDFAAMLQRFVGQAIARKVDLAIFPGDTFHTRHEGPEERAAFTEALRQLQAAGIAVIVLTGNHDGTTVIGDPRMSAMRWLLELRLPNVYVFIQDAHGFLIETRSGPVSVTALPYPHKRAFDKVLAEMDPERRVLEAGAKVERAIDAMAARAREMHPDVPQLFVGHLTVGGSTAGSETTMRFSWDVAIRPEVLDVFDYAALGHIHKLQKIGAKGWYAGSPDHLDFTEEGLDKGFLLVSFDVGTEPQVEVIPSSPRPMKTVVATQSDAGEWAVEPIPQHVPAGAIVQLRVHPKGKLDAEQVGRLERALREAGASFIKTRVIAPDVGEATRAEVDADLDPIEATRRWLEANQHPTEPAITEARGLIAAA